MMEEIVKSLSGLGAVGLVAAGLFVLSWFRETRTLPRMLDDFKDRGDKDRQAWTEQADKMRTWSSDLANKERETCERRHKDILEEGRRQHGELMAFNERLRIELLADHQKNRHATKSLEQSVMLLSKEVALENDEITRRESTASEGRSSRLKGDRDD